MNEDAEADFSAFYGETWSRTVACAYGVLADLGAAEEIAQEAYTRAWPRWPVLRDYDEPAAWVRQVCTRLAINRWRRRQVARRFLEHSRPPEHVAAPDGSAVVLTRALGGLPVAQRRAVVLHHLGDLSIRQIAQLEGCAEGTVKARLSRGRAALAGLLRDDAADTSTGLENSNV